MNLSLEEARLFFELMWGLQHYTTAARWSLRYSITFKICRIASREKTQSSRGPVEISGLIDEYVKENPNHSHPNT